MINTTIRSIQDTMRQDTGVDCNTTRFSKQGETRATRRLTSPGASA